MKIKPEGKGTFNLRGPQDLVALSILRYLAPK